MKRQTNANELYKMGGKIEAAMSDGNIRRANKIARARKRAALKQR